MATVKWNQDINAGQSWDADINMLNNNGSTRDITGWTLESKIKRHYRSVAVKEFMSINILNAVTGNMTLALTPKQTSNLKSGKYLYDVEATDRRTPAIGISGDGNEATAIAFVNSDGVISNIKVTNGGTGYTEATTITIADPLSDGGTTATATATVAGGEITVINIVDGGSGYLEQPKERVIQGVITIRPEITTD
jgi:hypothetical protein